MLIRMNNITKTFGSLVANDNVNLTLEDGEILSVVGENGAGKSTLMKILYGLESQDSGDIFINEEKVTFHSPSDAIKNGIGMVQQHFMLFPPFSAAENIVYSHEKKKGIFFDRKKAKEDVESLCNKYGLYVDPSVKVKDCPVGIQQRIEILKVLYQGVNIIIFDEPSAVLTPQEVDELLKTILDLKKNGKSIILITHKLNEVMAVSDRVMIMRGGKKVKEMAKSETSIEEMSYLMVGHELPKREIKNVEKGNDVLLIKDLTLQGVGEKNILNNLSLNVRKGEIVGLAGVSGNGQSELIECITGLKNNYSGYIELDGKDVSNKSVSEINKQGSSCIPEDRYFSGSAGEATLEENCIMGHYQNKKELLEHGFLKTKNVKEFSTKIMDEFDVRYNQSKEEMRDLSGGNAQKLIVAREISKKSPFLLASEPTRGIDIGAIDYIHGKLLEKREHGDGILLISSELSEILELSDRIYVLYDGEIVGEFKREDATSEKLGLLMMGGKLNE